MKNMSIIYEASITEWIQAIGVLLGVPATIWGIFKLFKKNKEHEQTITTLEQIVKEQNDVVKQLNKHVHFMSIQSELHQYHSTLMLESNKLLEQQINIQTDAFLHNKDIERQKIEIEKQKRINAVRPYFISHTSGSGPNNFFFYLSNNGGDALNVRLEVVEAENIIFNSLSPDLKVVKGDRVEIKGRISLQIHHLNGGNIPFTVKLVFSDVDKNDYYQLIKRENAEIYIVKEPIAVSGKV